MPRGAEGRGSLVNTRERLLASVDHVEPDRVPLFHPNIIDTYEPYDAELTAYLNAFSFDDLTAIGGYVQAPGQPRTLEDGTIVDGFGCRFQYKGVGLPYCIYSPLAEAQTVADIDAHDWPDPMAEGMISPDAAVRAAKLRASGDCVVAVGVGHIFHQYHYLRGFEAWMLDVKLNRAVHQAIAAHVYEVNYGLLMRLLDEVGPYVDVVTAGDDFGTSTSTYWSPADFRALIKPFYADLIGAIKARFPHIRVYLHSHGQIMDIVPDLLECGVDILNPVLPLDGMDPVALKRDFGDDLCFHAGIDIERIVPFGTVDEVRDHVRRVIDILAPGGGYWFKLQAISPVCPAENVIAAYDVAAEYGKYPIGGS